METELIKSDPAVMMGKPVVAGTRITVELIRDKVSAGETIEQLLEEHPSLTREGVLAALSRNTNSNSYIEAWRERLHRETAELDRALAEARARAKDCAALLAGKFGASEVYLIGSVAGAGRFHERSDIDLCARGLDSRRYFQALSEAAEIAGRDVDLILLEEAPPELALRTEREGVLLHGRPKVPASQG